MFSEEDAAAQLSILRAIASSDLHNLVYLSDYRIVPVVTVNRASRPTMEPEQREKSRAIERPVRIAQRPVRDDGGGARRRR